jgi:hypothetical protein
VQLPATRVGAPGVASGLPGILLSGSVAHPAHSRKSRIASGGTSRHNSFPGRRER